jgi:hypothetical protein
MRYPQEKHNLVYAASPSTDSGPPSALSGNSGFASLADFEKKDLVSQCPPSIPRDFSSSAKSWSRRLLRYLLTIPPSDPKATHPYSQIRHSISLTRPGYFRYRCYVLRTHKILPYTKPRYSGQYPSVGDSGNALADIYAPRYSDSYIFDEPYNALFLCLWYRCSQQSEFMCEYYWIHHARSARSCLGSWDGAIPYGQDWERSLGILLQSNHRQNSSGGRELR